MVYSQAFMEVQRTKDFDRWLRRLKDRQGRDRILLRLRGILLAGNLGDYKYLGDSVYELRFDFGPGYRIYWARRETCILLLLAGGDKSSQQRDIARAKRLNKRYD